MEPGEAPAADTSAWDLDPAQLRGWRSAMQANLAGSGQPPWDAVGSVPEQQATLDARSTTLGAFSGQRPQRFADVMCMLQRSARQSCRQWAAPLGRHGQRAGAECYSRCSLNDPGRFFRPVSEEWNSHMRGASRCMPSWLAVGSLLGTPEADGSSLCQETRSTALSAFSVSEQRKHAYA